MKENLFLRAVETTDIDLLYEWANNGEVRKNAFHTDIISFDTHKKWFEELKQSEDQKQYILMLEDEPIGQIRLSIKGERAEIDYSIAEDKRGNGYGQRIIELLCEKVKTEYPTVKVLAAKIKPENVISIKCFEKNNFIEVYRQLELRV